VEPADPQLTVQVADAGDDAGKLLARVAQTQAML
jgi:hypothetical protein